MRIIFISFFIIFLCFSHSSAKNADKITIDDIEKIFFGNQKKYPIINKRKKITSEQRELNKKLRKARELPSYKKRHETRGIAKCLFDPKGGPDEFRRCDAKIIRAVLSYPEKSKKRRPGDIFYALTAISSLTGDYEEWRGFIKMFDFKPGDKPVPGMVCRELPSGKKLFCQAFKKSTYKKIEKFKKDPSNEKVLGHKLIKYIKNRKMVNSFHEKLGTKSYGLLGDMLNDVVGDVKKTKINPELKLQRQLLKKYSLILSNVEDKLIENKTKTIQKDVSKLTNTFKDLKKVKSDNELSININSAVNVISDLDKLIKNSVVKLVENNEEKSLTFSSIYLMQHLIDLILSKIPDKYYAEQKMLSKDLWADIEIERLEIAINSMIEKTKQTKSEKLSKSIDEITKHTKSIKPKDLLNKFSDLGFKNNLDETFNQDELVKVVQNNIRDNLSASVMKDVKKLLQEFDKNELSEITKEATEIAREVANDPQTKSMWDEKVYGSVTLKQLIGAHYSGHIDLGIGGR